MAPRSSRRSLVLLFAYWLWLGTADIPHRGETRATSILVADFSQRDERSGVRRDARQVAVSCSRHRSCALPGPACGRRCVDVALIGGATDDERWRWRFPGAGASGRGSPDRSRARPRLRGHARGAGWPQRQAARARARRGREQGRGAARARRGAIALRGGSASRSSRSSSSIRRQTATTGSLDALRAYALGVEQAGSGNYPVAVSLFERAVQLDPEFAVAHQALAREQMNSGTHRKWWPRRRRVRTSSGRARPNRSA